MDNERAPLAAVVAPRHTAVLVVDVQPLFTALPLAPALDGVLPRLRRFLDGARAAGVPRVFIRRVIPEDRWTAVWRRQHPNRVGPDGPALGEFSLKDALAPGNPMDAFAPGFEPEPGDLVVVKERYCAFVGTGPAARLRARGIRTVVLVGLTTDIGVGSTARDCVGRLEYPFEQISSSIRYMTALHSVGAPPVGGAPVPPVLTRSPYADAPVPPLWPSRPFPGSHAPATPVRRDEACRTGRRAGRAHRPRAWSARARRREGIPAPATRRPPAQRHAPALHAGRPRAPGVARQSHPAWCQALLIVQPETMLRWHRQGFRLSWRRKSRPRSAPQPKVPAETIALIRELSIANRLWGAERIRGELLKLGISVDKTTVQRHMRDARPPRRAGQTWATFLRNHAAVTWACDLLPVTDVLLRPRYAFVVVALGSRRVVHLGVTRHPTDAWVAQLLRQATPFGQRPRHLIRDIDSKCGPTFARAAATIGITELRTAYRAPRQNALCERFLGSVRRECLDHVLVLGERHLRRLLREYTDYYNRVRPHQGLHQQAPDALAGGPPQRERFGAVHAIPILGGLHHDYQRAA